MRATALDGDPNEFASGRGTSRFMNANFISALTLRLQYSTLGGGVVWMPIPTGPDGGITISSMIINTVDSSTTTGFDDFGDGLTWTTEANFHVGFYYTRNQELRFFNLVGVDVSSYGFEAFYNVAITPAAHLTVDAQVVESPAVNIDTAVILGLRLGLTF